MSERVCRRDRRAAPGLIPFPAAEWSHFRYDAPVSVHPAAVPPPDTLYEVLMGPVALNQSMSGAKEMREAEESEESGECSAFVRLPPPPATRSSQCLISTWTQSFSRFNAGKRTHLRQSPFRMW